MKQDWEEGVSVRAVIIIVADRADIGHRADLMLKTCDTLLAAAIRSFVMHFCRAPSIEETKTKIRRRSRDGVMTLVLPK